MKITEITLTPEIQKALEKMGYEDFTPIQEMTLPALLSGQDVLGEAPTGTGKTAAYCLPMISKVVTKNNQIQGLVICPTRELAIQVVQELAKFAKFIPELHYVAIYGGQNVSTQLRELKVKPQIIVGTPGRLKDLVNRKNLDFSKVNYLVLDECDEMLEMGFIKDVSFLIEQVTSPHQTALFSATISKDIQKVAERYLKKDVKRVEIKRTPSQENQIAQKYILLQEKEKTTAIIDLLNGLTFTRAFVFCRTKHKVKQLEKILQKSTSHAITSLQGNLSQNKRDKAMKAFRDYEADVMVATDIAARGIDVNDVDLVVNYDIPEEDEFYLHRIGRTGRVDKSGVSYTFITPAEKMMIKKYESLTHCPLEQYVIDKGDVMKKYLEGLQPKLKDDLTSEKDAINEACASLSAKEGREVTPLELAAVLLKEKMDDPGSALSEERDYSKSHNASIERNKEKKRFVTDPNNQRFFINVGFEDGANEDNLKSFIIGETKGLKTRFRRHLPQRHLLFLRVAQSKRG
jgi:ATP-dependent RNA helicase DeaD